jgi:hypothetical protein
VQLRDVAYGKTYDDEPCVAGCGEGTGVGTAFAIVVAYWRRSDVTGAFPCRGSSAIPRCIDSGKCCAPHQPADCLITIPATHW